MIPENHKEVVMEALLFAAMDDSMEFYHMTVHEVSFLADKITKIMQKNGYNIYRTTGSEKVTERKKRELCKTS